MSPIKKTRLFVKASLLSTATAFLACTSSPPADAPPSDAAICASTDVGPPLLRRLTNAELENTLGDIFPAIKASWRGVKLGVDPISHLGFANDASVLQVNQQTAQEILDTAEEVATLVTTSPAFEQILPCAKTTPDRACASSFMQTQGRRLFRRAVTDAELQDYLSLYDSVSVKSSFASGVKWMLVAAIQSPNSIYRSELGNVEGDVRKLTQHEIATELAYNYSGTTPSAELLDKADRGELSSPQALAAEAKTLLDSPRGQEVVRQLFRYWFRYERAASVTRPDVANYFTVRTSLVEETKRFIDQVVLTDRGGLKPLLTADFTFLDKTLTSHYGYGSATTDFVRTQRPASWGVGILAQGSILAANAQAQGSSPTQRGLLIYEKLLCNRRPDPPPNIPAIPPPAPGASTTRDRYEKQHVQSGCLYCHKQFDPLGFAFEHFDEVGRYRADEKGLAIDDSARVINAADELLFTATGQVDMSQQLSARDDVRACAADMMAAYSFGIGDGVPGCLVRKIRPDLTSSESSFLDYLLGLTASPHFTTRR
jgi:hypothetical protein